MSWAETLLVLLGLLLGSFASGIPIFVAFFAICIGTMMVLFGDRGFGMISNSILTATSTVSLSTVAMFVLMGDLLFRSGSTEVLFDAANRVFGRLRGRLYYLVIALSTVFGALSGSIVAVTAMLGRSILPSMNARGYDEGLSITTILSGASLAPIIPPSIVVIILGSLVNVSIAGLLVAGLLPGFLIAALTSLYVWIRITRNPALAPEDTVFENEDAQGDSLGWLLLKCLPFLMVIFSVIGFILLGIATPSEAAASGVIGALITTLLYRKLSLSFLFDSLKEAALLTGSIMAIFAASSLFAQILSFTGASRGFLNYFLAQDLTGLTAFLAIMIITLVACMFIDVIAYMLVSVPIYAPIAGAFGFDPIWFWAIYLINVTLGSVTPPFGYALFSLKAASPELSMGRTYRSAWSVVAIFTIAITILYLVPGIVTLIPSLL
jgi:tripartite ATP-independent transporter DctM subunit